jgi:hypothetical protein
MLRLSSKYSKKPCPDPDSNPYSRIVLIDGSENVIRSSLLVCTVHGVHKTITDKKRVTFTFRFLWFMKCFNNHTVAAYN